MLCGYVPLEGMGDGTFRKPCRKLYSQVAGGVGGLYFLLLQFSDDN